MELRGQGGESASHTAVTLATEYERRCSCYGDWGGGSYQSKLDGR